MSNPECVRIVTIMKKYFRLMFLILLIALAFALNKLDYKYPTTQARIIYSNNIRELVYHIDTEAEKAKFNPKIVTVSKDDSVITHLTTATTPINALIDLDYSISNRNTVITTSPTYSLLNGSFIKIRTFYTSIEDIQTEIPYATIVKGDTLCEKLSSQVVEQRGVLGVMTTTMKRVFEGSNVVLEEVLNQEVNSEPRAEILVIKGPDDSPKDVPQRGYNCDYWYAYVNSLSIPDSEKDWLKYIMKCESGCNAESNKGYYKGLFQWDPCYWYKQFPNDNIFDGAAQIKHTLEKFRAGGQNMWPACNNRYQSTH
jgi:hypothetical protein